MKRDQVPTVEEWNSFISLLVDFGLDNGDDILTWIKCHLNVDTNSPYCQRINLPWKCELCSFTVYKERTGKGTS